MRDKGNVYNAVKALPRMSWAPANLFNLYNRSLGRPALDTRFNKSSLTLYQQKWSSKRLARGYHGDHIPETSFKRWYLPPNLPVIRPTSASITATGATEKSERHGLAKWARGQERREERQREQSVKEAASAPVGSLMFVEVERRIDTLVFRACLASSIYEARRLIVTGKVKLNGVKHKDPNTRLDPGDLVCVEPRYAACLQPGRVSKPSSKKPSASLEPSDSEPEPEASTSSSDSSSDSPSPSSEPTSTPSSTAPLPFHLPPYASPHLFVPAYLEPSFATCSFIYVRHPTARAGYSEIPSPYEADGEVMRLAWEWYVGRRIRARSLGGGPWGGPRRPGGVKRGREEARRG